MRTLMSVPNFKQLMHILFIRWAIGFSAMAFALLFACSKPQETIGLDEVNWQMLPFVKTADVNPCLLPDTTRLFRCSLKKTTLQWEAKDVFNPAAIVWRDTLWLLYRAEDLVGRHLGTSRLGLAFSVDGFTFTKFPEPVFYPDSDPMQVFEWEGGVEDPRLVQDEKGTFWLTYTAYDGMTARLCVASSPDLRKWTKHGLAFGESAGGKFRNLWSKSGAIVAEWKGSQLVAKKIQGKYWMYWGDTDMYLATSGDLIHWNPVMGDGGELFKVMQPRPGKFDSKLIEPGPPPIVTKYGILMLYNASNLAEGGDPELPEGTYAAGQALFNPENPMECLRRAEGYFLKPEHDFEITGQVGNVCFIEGLVQYKNTWFLYYGTADSKIGVATYTPGEISL
jgi:predicted GH43/DUF377 family glycosyl hydrolase